MAHAIATIDGKSAMAYQGETPWHQLGVKADSIPDVDTALKLGTLDWEVKLQPIVTGNPRTVDPDVYIRVPNRQAVVRMTLHPYVLGTVGMSYQPLQNRPAFEVLDLAVQEFGVQIETCGALGEGERVWMLAKLPKTLTVTDGDTVEGYFLISTGHDGATPYTARPTPVRVVCRNTLDLAILHSKAIIRLTHAGNTTDKLKLVQKMIKDLIHTMTITGETFTRMAQRELNEHEMKAYVEAVLSIEDGSAVAGVLAKRRDTILHLAYNGTGVDFSPGSLWNGYNAFTEYVDHVRPMEVNPVKKQRANESALFGANAALKARALGLAEQLIEA